MVSFRVGLWDMLLLLLLLREQFFFAASRRPRHSDCSSSFFPSRFSSRDRASIVILRPFHHILSAIVVCFFCRLQLHTRSCHPETLCRRTLDLAHEASVQLWV